MMKTLAIYGSGGLGREVLDLAKTINSSERKWDEIVFINDFKNESTINGANVFTFDEFKEKFTPIDSKVVSLSVSRNIGRCCVKKLSRMGMGFRR